MKNGNTDSIFRSIVEKKKTSWGAFGETNNSSYNVHSLSIIESENHITERTRHDQIDTFWERTFDIFYISDLHLDNHILQRYPEGASDKEILEYLNMVVNDLLSGKIRQQLKKMESPKVLFGGDISSSFTISKLFFEQFVAHWQSIRKEVYGPVIQEYESLWSVIDDCNTKMASLMDSDADSDILHEYRKQIKRAEIRLDSLYYKTRIPRSRDDLGKWASYVMSPQYVYAVLGNHEFWDFASYDVCVDSYAKLFDNLGVKFLNNSIMSVGHYYKQAGFTSFSTFIVGGTGFAPLNPSFNANQKIYGNAVDEKAELIYSKKFKNAFKRALSLAKEQNSTLLVLTHNPVQDWLEPTDNPGNCVFFTGHTHKNIAIQTDKNVQIIADNQVGYRSNRIKFRKVVIDRVRDPFADYQDGFHEITTDEYWEYYKYISDSIPGKGTLEYQISNFGAHLWVIKKQGYFGFFLTSPKGTYICNGGAIRKIGKKNDMDYYYSSFEQMVNLYLMYLSPLRKLQEEISSRIKAIGGDGTIHGCIVDIDFFNHIMVNPQDGSLTFYYSPTLGLVEPYDDIRSLLTAHCSYLLPGLSSVSGEELLPQIANSSGNELIQVDLKHSGYAVSRRVNALQRLFGKHTLRDWNDDALQKSRSKIENTNTQGLLAGDNKDKKKRESTQE